MLVKKLFASCLALAILTIAATAMAQSDTEPSKPKTLATRLDNLGKFIFGGTYPPEKATKDEKSSKPAASIEYPGPRNAAVPKPSTTAKPSLTGRPPVTAKPTVENVVPEEVSTPYYKSTATPRAGSVLERSETSQGNSPLLRGSNTDADFTPENTPPAVSRVAEATPRQDSRPTVNAAPREEQERVADDATTPSPVVVGPSSQVVTGTYPETTIRRPTDGPALARPLHERLSSVRVSVFAADNAAKSSQPATEQTETPRVPEKVAKSEQTEPSGAAAPTPTARPVVVPQSTPAVAVERPQTAEPVAMPKRVTMPTATPKAVTPRPDTLVVETVERQPVVDENMLIARRGPSLSVETLGPRRIMVGKEATYQVNIINSGETAADDLTVFVSLPEWTEIAGVEASAGVARTESMNREPGALAWKIDHLDARGRERLTLRVTPRQSRPFDLAVRWECKPVASQAAIEVQEPKLSLQLEGPREVLYGKKENYRLKLTNIGTGRADNVVLTLMPIGGGDGVPATHRIGLLGAGEEKALDVELTARQAGNLTIQVSVKADGDAKAELTERVVVRRAGLKIGMDGPRVQFVGATATYAIRVRNPGTAAARDINLSAVLPAGAKYVSGIDGAKFDSATGKLNWSIETMAADAEQVFAIRCVLNAAGISRVQVVASAADDLTTSTETVTRVESVANLTMEVRDPEQPVQVGDEATYEVRIRNRGTKAATDVDVAAFFSRGIEPIGAEGTPNRVAPGQVTFQSIPTIAPGAEVVLKVRARAELAGNHIFRAEAQCRTLGTRLIREATNLYYTEAMAGQQLAQESEPEKTQAEPMRTGNRAGAMPMTPNVPMRK